MLLNLVKKDFILVKNKLALMLVFTIGAPIFIAYQVDINSGGFLEFFLTTFFTLYLLFNTVSWAEDKYKGSTLLSATPYTRKSLVQAKYLFILAVFLICYLIYTATVILSPIDVPMLNLYMVGIVLLIITTLLGIIIPLQYQFGYEKTKYIFMILVFVSPFVIPLLVKEMQANNIGFPVTLAFPTIIHNLLPYLLVLVISYFSMMVSIHIYYKKNL